MPGATLLFGAPGGSVVGKRGAPVTKSFANEFEFGPFKLYGTSPFGNELYLFKTAFSNAQVLTGHMPGSTGWLYVLFGEPGLSRGSSRPLLPLLGTPIKLGFVPNNDNVVAHPSSGQVTCTKQCCFPVRRGAPERRRQMNRTSRPLGSVHLSGLLKT